VPASQPVSSFQEKLSMTRRDGRYVITAAAILPGEPVVPPWLGELRFAQGRRVTVAAAPSQAKRLRAVVAAADKAAVTADRYARLVHNPQEHYRVYLAGDAEWKTWFGGPPVINAAGYATPVGIASTDVVLRMSELRDGDPLPEMIRHELGHVVTLNGVEAGWKAYEAHAWLIEGVAEYIAYAPRPATANPSHVEVAAAKKLPRTMAVPALGSLSSDDEVSRFYGLGHHAVSCLVGRYGEPAVFGFVVKVLREGKGYDRASREAFGRPFVVVDRDCVDRIRRLAG
jgi:hypothetical protein